jgi:phage repressor protein C with HTH and peptisase S24 domain
MLSHKQIWSAIDALAARHGHSPSALARAAGLDPTTFNKSKRHGPEGRLRWPSTESLSRILSATGATLDEFVSLIAKGRGNKALPLATLKDASKKKAFNGDGRPVAKGWGKLAFPDLNDDRAFALEISNDAAAPEFRVGDVIVVSPAALVKRGDIVVVKARDGLSVARFVRKSTKRVELTSLDPKLPDRSLDSDDVDWIARIVWAKC